MALAGCGRGIGVVYPVSLLNTAGHHRDLLERRTKTRSAISARDCCSRWPDAHGEIQMRRSVSGRTYRIVVQLLAGCRMARPVTADDSREAGRVGEAPGLLWAVLGGGHRVSHHIDLDSFQNRVDGDHVQFSR